MPKRKGIYLGPPRDSSGNVGRPDAEAKLARLGLNSAGPVVYREGAPTGSGWGYFSRDVVGRGEHHFHDVDVTGMDLDTAGEVKLLNAIAEGTSTQQRTGRKVAITGMTMRFKAEADTTATNNQVLILLVEDLRPVGSNPAITDILEAATPWAMNNEAGFGRFKIHMRKRFCLKGQGTGGAAVDESAPYVRNFDKYKKMRNRKVHYSGSNGTIGEIITGALFLITLGTAAAGTTSGSLTGNIRLSYRDTK